MPAPAGTALWIGKQGGSGHPHSPGACNKYAAGGRWLGYARSAAEEGREDRWPLILLHMLGTHFNLQRGSLVNFRASTRES